MREKNGRLAHFLFVEQKCDHMQLNDLIEKTVVGLGFELVDVEASPRARLLRDFMIFLSIRLQGCRIKSSFWCISLFLMDKRKFN